MSKVAWYEEIKRRERNVAWDIFLIVKQMRWVKDWVARSDSNIFHINVQDSIYQVTVMQVDDFPD